MSCVYREMFYHHDAALYEWWVVKTWWRVVWDQKARPPSACAPFSAPPSPPAPPRPCQLLIVLRSSSCSRGAQVCISLTLAEGRKWRSFSMSSSWMSRRFILAVHSASSLLTLFFYLLVCLFLNLILSHFCAKLITETLIHVSHWMFYVHLHVLFKTFGFQGHYLFRFLFLLLLFFFFPPFLPILWLLPSLSLSRLSISRQHFTRTLRFSPPINGRGKDTRGHPWPSWRMFVCIYDLFFFLCGAISGGNFPFLSIYRTDVSSAREEFCPGSFFLCLCDLHMYWCLWDACIVTRVWLCYLLIFFSL